MDLTDILGHAMLYLHVSDIFICGAVSKSWHAFTNRIRATVHIQRWLRALKPTKMISSWYDSGRFNVETVRRVKMEYKRRCMYYPGFYQSLSSNIVADEIMKQEGRCSRSGDSEYDIFTVPRHLTANYRHFPSTDGMPTSILSTRQPADRQNARIKEFHERTCGRKVNVDALRAVMKELKSMSIERHPLSSLECWESVRYI